MTISRRRGLAGLLAVIALAIAGVGLTATPVQAEDPPPPDGSQFNPYPDLATLPIEIINCNIDAALIPEGTFLTMCIEMTFEGGTAKFGNIDSTIEGPIKVRQVVAVVFGPGGFTDISIVTIDESTSGGGSGFAFPTIDVPGGLLGNAALNDLLRPVTGVTAQIEPLGELTLNDLNQNLILEALFTGENTETLLAVANLPFRVKVNNLLLGETCYIGSPEDPVDLNLPLHLTEVDQWNSSFAVPQPPPELTFQYFVWKADATDATFDIPEADGCGLLGTGELLDPVGLNLFDMLVNQSVGLPAPAGTNLLSLQGYFGMSFAGFDGVADPAAP